MTKKLEKSEMVMQHPLVDLTWNDSIDIVTSNEHGNFHNENIVCWREIDVFHTILTLIEDETITDFRINGVSDQWGFGL